jgi:AcrR family transcriptional regulator
MDETHRLVYAAIMSVVFAPRSDARRSPRAHRAILTAAAEIVARRGYGATSIEEIAAEAGVGKQTVYRWWPNKAALFIEVYGELVPADLAAKNTGSLAGDLRALLSSLFRVYSETSAGHILAGLIAEAQTGPALAEQLRSTYVTPRRTIIGSILDRAAAGGEIVGNYDADFASDFFSGAVWFRLLLGDSRLDENFVDALIAVLLRGAVRLAPVTSENDSSAEG